VQCSPPIMWIIPSPHLTLPKKLLLEARTTLVTRAAASELVVVDQDEVLLCLFSSWCHPEVSVNSCHGTVPLVCDGKEHFLPLPTLA
jgi:hypothetical protein